MNERIDRLEWDEWNTEHIEKHGISIEEIESVISDDPVATESYKNRLLVIGPSWLGRMIAVVIGRVPATEGAWYVFSARPASRRERTRYGQMKGDQPS
jgi:uncharacterized DUF497 family protein